MPSRHIFRSPPKAGLNGSGLPQKLGAQHQALHLVGAAFDLVLVAVEADVLDHRAALDDGGRALELEILDDGDGIALVELRAVRILDDDVHWRSLVVRCMAGIVARMCANGWPQVKCKQAARPVLM